MASGGQVPASLSMRPVWQRPPPRPSRPRAANGSPLPGLPWKPKTPVLRGRGSGAAGAAGAEAKRSKRPAEELTGLGHAVEISRGVALLAWPFLVHMLFQLTDKLDAFDGLLGRNLTMRVLVYVGSSMWLMKAALATDLRYTTRALNQLVSRVFQAAGLEGWLAEKSSEFVISVLMRVSRVTVALAALTLSRKQKSQGNGNESCFRLVRLTSCNAQGVLASAEELWLSRASDHLGVGSVQFRVSENVRLKLVGRVSC